jgi:N-acetylmuramoyl-L-alanine amidase CwlD
VAASLVFFAAGPGGAGQREQEPVKALSWALAEKVIVVDPGHGGVDPGAVGKNSALEKDIVLAIGQRLALFLRQGGATVLMTRETDTDLSDPELSGLYAKKRQDLARRVALANKSKADLLISIHINSYPDPRQHGAQTFYQRNVPESRRLAQAIQNELNSFLNDDRRAPLTGDYYILRETKIPAVIVETGFLSNPREAKKLLDPAYQSKIAFCLFTGLVRYFAPEEGKIQPVPGAESAPAKREQIVPAALFCPPAGRAAPPQAPRHVCGEEKPVVLSGPFQKGADVFNLQECLFSLGYYRGGRDGFYGPLTIEAVKSFQTDQGLPSTGVATPATWEAISREMGKHVDTLSPPGDYYDVVLLVDTFRLTLTVFANGEPLKKYPVAAGRPGSETPVGVFQVVDKSAEPAPGIGTRWLGLNVPGGNYGVHGTDNPWSIGTYASGGCIRLHNAHIQEIYPLVSAGTWVIITGNPFGRFGEEYPLLQEGNCGSAVREVQYKLKRLGFYKGTPDGIFGPGTAAAVSAFRQKNGLAPGSHVDEEIYHLLGL